MVLHLYEVTFSFAGTLQIQAEDENDAIHQVQQKDNEMLMSRLDSDRFMIHSADEVDIGGPS